MSPTNYCSSYMYKFDNDTLINGNTWHKLYGRDSSVTTFDYICSMREDSSTGLIYVNYPQNCNLQDSLLYDFNWQSGDTVKVCPYILGDIYSLVINIDSIQILGQWRRRMELDGGTYTTKIVEGIGSLNGIVGPFHGWIDGHLVLQCYSINGASIFPSGTCSNTLVENLDSDSWNILYLNDGKLQIKSQNYLKGQYSIMLYDMLGHEIRTVNNPDFVNNNSLVIDMTEFHIGFYVIELINRENDLRRIFKVFKND